MNDQKQKKRLFGRKKEPVDNSMPPLDTDDSIPDRGGHGALWVTALCLVAAAALLISSLPSGVISGTSVQSRVLTAQPENKAISTALLGAGTLTPPEGEDLEIPQALELEARYAENGDTVCAGDPIVKVDKVAVHAAIAELQELLEDLDAAIAKVTNDSPSTSVKATASGRVKKIYAQKDAAVADTVYDSGALVLLSLDGTMAVGSADDICTTGHIRIGTATPEMLESTVEKGDIVILTNRYESQLCAIEKEASLLILCNNAKVGRTIQRIAEETGVAIMTTPVDTYAAGKLISQCAPISYYMTRSDIMKFTLVTPVADVTRVMAKVRHRYFPILDEDGKYCGMVSRRNIINLRKRRIILVDHNEATQAVEGFDQAEILEIIDHHRIGSLETSGPVYFRNQPVGCTATIVTQMYDENGVEIPPQTAGLLLAAILSDTLMFRSPTCTPVDEASARRLAKIAGVDINEFANEMFEAGEKLDGKTAEEVFLQDFKVFMCGDIRFGVAQGSYMTRKNLLAAEALLQPYLEEARNKQNVEDIYMLLTDVPKEESVVISDGRYASEVLSDGFETQPAEDGSFTLPGVVSRKKQFIPALMTAYQEL